MILQPCLFVDVIGHVVRMTDIKDDYALELDS